MGANAAKSNGDVESVNVNNFNAKMKNACLEANDGSGDVEAYERIWKLMDPERKSNPRVDEGLVGDNCVKWLKFAFRHHDSRWRKAGILVTRTFFKLPKVKEKLIILDFIGSVLLITLPADDMAEDDTEPKQGSQHEAQSKHHEQLQLLATETICEMADHDEFIDSLCSTSVLNFLCIVLNQVPMAVETVTHTFVKLSENPDNLVVLMEGAVGDILESFFQTVKFHKPADDEEDLLKQWKKDIPALSHCAHTLGTLMKYKHECQVNKSTIIECFEYALDMEKDQSFFVRLLAELSRLYYWVCRRSEDIAETLQKSCPDDTPHGDDDDLAAGVETDRVLNAMVRMWNERCVEIHELIERALEAQRKGAAYPDDFLKIFCVDDLDRNLKLTPLPKGSKETEDPIRDKIDYAHMRLCYMNCTLWVLLPINSLRWKLQNLGLKDLHLAFDVRKEAFLQVILGTVRHLVDLPEAQESPDFIKFFGEQLLILLDLALSDEHSPLIPVSVTMLLLDAISILAMNRNMQEMLAEYAIYDKLQDLVNIQKDPTKKHQIELTALRTSGEIAMHPSHRLSWVAPTHLSNASYTYPDREGFKAKLEEKMNNPDSNFQNLAALLLTIFNEEKFKKPPEEVETTYKSVLEWWQANTTARFEDEKEAQLEALESGLARQPVDLQNSTKPLAVLLQRAVRRREEKRGLTILETTAYCAPHECVLALTLFARLALEPKFKKLISEAIIPLLGCVCEGIWAEAREAAACLANLMWLPDMAEEKLVCWLKFDGPKCITVDGANVLLPIKVGTPKPAEIGKGMYRSSWGIEFVDGAAVTLHPDGLKTFQIPGLLTSASPSDHFTNTSRKPYETLEEEDVQREAMEEGKRHFSITCWFYWPTAWGGPARKKVLVQTTTREHLSQIWLDIGVGDGPGEDGEEQATWCITDDQKRTYRIKTPRLNPGWHMLALLSSTPKSKANPFEGTKFFIDDWHRLLEKTYVKNEFYMVGNDAGHGGKQPFGLICDFRIYARTLRDDEVENMLHSKDTDSHPNGIARRLASLDAATILAQRLDVPDSAAECMRALGSLATVSTERAKIFSVCGRRMLEMLESPLPMLQRQAARLANNIT